MSTSAISLPRRALQLKMSPSIPNPNWALPAPMRTIFTVSPYLPGFSHARRRLTRARCELRIVPRGAPLRVPEVMADPALVAEENVGLPIPQGFLCPLGSASMARPTPHQVHEPLGQGLLCLLGRADPADADHRDPHCLAHRSAEEQAVRPRAALGTELRCAADSGGDVEERHAVFLQPLRDLDALGHGEAAGRVLRGTEPARDEQTETLRRRACAGQPRATNRARFSRLPPQRSSRVFARGDRN